MFFLQVYHDSHFFHEIFSTYLTMQCFKCLFHMDIHTVCGICLTIKWYIRKYLQKKTTTFFASSGRYQCFRHLLQNQKPIRNIMGFNTHNYSHKVLNSRALQNNSFAHQVGTNQNLLELLGKNKCWF